MKNDFEIVLKEWSTQEQRAVVSAVLFGGKRYSLNAASRRVNKLNRLEGFTYGGFGRYYSFERANGN